LRHAPRAEIPWTRPMPRDPIGFMLLKIHGLFLFGLKVYADFIKLLPALYEFSDVMQNRPRRRTDSTCVSPFSRI
jgi:hypothetical protein